MPVSNEINSHHPFVHITIWIGSLLDVQHVDVLFDLVEVLPFGGCCLLDTVFKLVGMTHEYLRIRSSFDLNY